MQVILLVPGLPTKLWHRQSRRGSARVPSGVRWQHSATMRNFTWGAAPHGNIAKPAVRSSYDRPVALFFLWTLLGPAHPYPRRCSRDCREAHSTVPVGPRRGPFHGSARHTSRSSARRAPSAARHGRSAVSCAQLPSHRPRGFGALVKLRTYIITDTTVLFITTPRLMDCYWENIYEHRAPPQKLEKTRQSMKKKIF